MAGSSGGSPEAPGQLHVCTPVRCAQLEDGNGDMQKQYNEIPNTMGGHMRVLKFTDGSQALCAHSVNLGDRVSVKHMPAE